MFGERESERRIGGSAPLPTVPLGYTHSSSVTYPHFFRPYRFAELYPELDLTPPPVPWDEVEDWDDAMPPRQTLRSATGEWDTDDGIDPRWIIGRLQIGLGDSVEDVARTEAEWPKRVPCFCGHTRTKHRTADDNHFGRCKARVTVIAPDGGFGEEPCPCIDPEPALPATQEAS